MNTTITTTLALTVFGIVFAVPALSQDDGAPPPPPGAMGHSRMAFPALDADGDGRLTEAEVRAAQLDSVAGLDRNADGKIAEDEAVAWAVAKASKAAAELAKRQFARRDLDGDGALTAEELMAPPARTGLFGRADSDGDGAVSKAEFDTMMAEIHDRMSGRGGEGRHRGHRLFGPTDEQGMPEYDGDR